jgi:hypothetical protein
MARTKTFLGGLTLGAGLVYFLDPDLGPFRRERVARTLGPLLDEARRTVQSGGAESSGTGLLRYGLRIGDIQGLGAATLNVPGFRSLSETPFTSAMRVLGGVLAIYGLTRRGTLGAMLRTLGAGMLVGAKGREAFTGSGLPTLDRRRAVDIQKTLYIEASVEQVYGFSCRTCGKSRI